MERRFNRLNDKFIGISVNLFLWFDVSFRLALGTLLWEQVTIPNDFSPLNYSVLPILIRVLGWIRLLTFVATVVLLTRNARFVHWMTLLLFQLTIIAFEVIQVGWTSDFDLRFTVEEWAVVIRGSQHTLVNLVACPAQFWRGRRT
jgi:hypothetical protein